MNRNHRTNAASLAAFLALVLTATLALPSLAQQSPGPPRKLEIGMPAPPLMIDTWVKGEPIEKLEKGHPYVIEFWATWCGPCRQTIPHLTELQQRYGDKLTIIGISSEPKGLPEVKPFVEKMGAKMDYRVAFDKGGGTNNAWMVAAGRQGIPCSFVVDQKGIIAWIGHPGELGAILDDVVADGIRHPLADLHLQIDRLLREQIGRGGLFTELVRGRDHPLGVERQQDGVPFVHRIKHDIRAATPAGEVLAESVLEGGGAGGEAEQGEQKEGGKAHEILPKQVARGGEGTAVPDVRVWRGSFHPA